MLIRVASTLFTFPRTYMLHAAGGGEARRASSPIHGAYSFTLAYFRGRSSDFPISFITHFQFPLARRRVRCIRRSFASPMPPAASPNRSARGSASRYRSNWALESWPTPTRGLFVRSRAPVRCAERTLRRWTRSLHELIRSLWALDPLYYSRDRIQRRINVTRLRSQGKRRITRC